MPADHLSALSFCVPDELMNLTGKTNQKYYMAIDCATLLAADYFAHSKTDAKFILGVKRIAKRQFLKYFINNFLIKKVCKFFK